MEQRTDSQLSPYRIFPRGEWAALRKDTPMTLSPEAVSYTHLTLPTTERV